MKRYYFTYGSADKEQPFVGGWSEVFAESESEARDKHIRMHGFSRNGLVRCGGVYGEAHFKSTGMYMHGNFGVKCHEVIE
jgi:hypothetical protein